MWQKKPMLAREPEASLQSRAREPEGSLRRNYESVPFAVLLIGTDGCVSSANPAAHRMLSQPDGALRGQRLDGLLPEHFQQVYGVFEDGICLRMQSRMLKADGRMLDVSLTAEPASRDEQQVSSVAVLCRPVPPWKTIPPHAPNG